MPAKPATTGARRESTLPIRTLQRGLAVLAELNKSGRAAIHTLAAALGLPRTTTFRILETLRASGFVERDARDDCYRPTLRVRSLSDGFDEEARVAHLAEPLLQDLGVRLAWPLAMATACGGAMLIRKTTEPQETPLVEPYRAGWRVPMLTSAAGRTHLAFCSAAQREALLELLARSSLPEDRLARNRREVERVLHETRSQGYGLVHRARRVAEETSLAVPVRTRGRVLAVLALHYAASAVPLRQAVDQFIPRMRELAQRVEAQSR